MAAPVVESNTDVNIAISSVLSDLACSFSLKEEQRRTLKAFVGGKDVFALLPTGFGKSFIYQIAPLVVKKMGRVQEPVVIVVSPLTALIEDQIREAGKFGVTGVSLGARHENEILHGHYQLVFGSPESWLNVKWRNMLASEVYQNNLVGIVVDEVHVTYKWGEGAKGVPAFRESFARLGELRSIVKEGTPVMALTASADIVNRRRVTKLLHMEKATQVIVSPNRSNIRLGLKHIPGSDLDCMDWVVTEVREKKLLMSPIIIYCRSIRAVGRVFCRLKAELGQDAWVNRDPEHKAENLLIGMYHSKTLPQYKQRVLASFTGEGSCRVVVATTALGMSLNFPNVSHVVMYGAPEDVEDIVQQVGRAGRNTLPSHAVLYVIKSSPRVNEGVKALINAGRQGCFRKALFSHFEEHATSLIPGHLCCSYCHSICSCSSGVCVEPIPKHECVEPNVYTAPPRSREVTEEDKNVIRACLQQYRRTLVPDMPLITNKTVCTGFGTELIEAAVKHSPYIFDLPYITNNLPVFRVRHASEILLVISEVFGDFEFTETTLPEENFTEPDIDFTGYFDEQDEDFDVLTQHSSGSESS